MSKSKSKYDYEIWGISPGDMDSFVAHAGKYTKEETVEIFNREYGYKGKATVEDVTDGYAKWFVRPNQFQSSDLTDNCGTYGFVDKPGKGVFPVWVIDINEVRKRANSNEQKDAV